MTISLLMGGSLFLSYTLPAWQTVEWQIQAPIRVWDVLDYDLKLGIHVGLDNVNITLQKAPVVVRINDPPALKKPVLPRLLPRNSLQLISQQPAATPTTSTTRKPPVVDHMNPEGVRFNEQIKLDASYEMKDQMKEALQRGLPVPILTVIQYFSHQEEGFRWSVDYRTAGYYCQFILICTISVWALMNALFVAVPRYGALAMILTGFLALVAVFVYWILLPDNKMVIHINGQFIQLHWGECYWTVLVTGCVACVAGTALYVGDLLQPGTLTFDLQMEDELQEKPSLDSNSRKDQLASAESEEPEVEPVPKKSPSKRKVTIEESESLKNQDSGISAYDSTGDRPDSFEKTASVPEQPQPQAAAVDGRLDEDEGPKTIGYTFRNGRELPSFHESTISLHSQLPVRFYGDSINEESAQVYPFPPDTETDSEFEDWQDPSEDIFDPPTVPATPFPRRLRRSVRNPSVG